MARIGPVGAMAGIYAQRAVANRLQPTQKKPKGKGPLGSLMESLLGGRKKGKKPMKYYPVYARQLTTGYNRIPAVYYPAPGFNLYFRGPRLVTMTKKGQKYVVQAPGPILSYEAAYGIPAQRYYPIADFRALKNAGIEGFTRQFQVQQGRANPLDILKKANKARYTGIPSGMGLTAVAKPKRPEEMRPRKRRYRP